MPTATADIPLRMLDALDAEIVEKGKADAVVWYDGPIDDAVVLHIGGLTLSGGAESSVLLLVEDDVVLRRDASHYASVKALQVQAIAVCRLAGGLADADTAVAARTKLYGLCDDFQRVFSAHNKTYGASYFGVLTIQPQGRGANIVDLEDTWVGLGQRFDMIYDTVHLLNTE